MARTSLALLAAAMTSMVAGQVSQLPVIEQPEGSECGGCYVVADVAAIVFGGIATITDSVITSVGVGPNGTNLTTATLTSTGSVTVTASQAQFTFDPTATSEAEAPIQYNDINGDATVTVAGAILTSPTQYQVFTAYSVTSFVSQDGSCSTVQGRPTILTSAYQYPIPEGADNNYLLDLEQSFINSIGSPSCSAGGGAVRTSVQSMVTRETQAIETQGPVRPTPVAASTLASSTPGQNPIEESSSVAESSTTVTFNGTIALPTGTGSYNPTIQPSIVPGAAAITSPASWILSTAVIAVGLAAVLL